ncbi:Diacylglycerol acyltransferase/mycolyltransferase Ag85A precursor [Corynebacterium capitovis DSM 44611]|uniref:alpha/beta hydrolase n=1 Tax=Corynebacterium capitovis TaxID=131081 RepID=UPI00035F05BD|nr:alpha/beta hydrolase family protein [Corynebacterium capitovis]WKD56749.1 Diacylglycerol acyltransferase/mycolyltransferase Ag85A precursor [Corynebacterium capitovis DSM 44611]
MKIARTVMAVAASLSLALGLAPAASAETTVKAWDVTTDVPLTVSGGKAQAWTKQVDHVSLHAYKVHSPSMGRDIPVAVIPATSAAGERVTEAPTFYLLNGAGSAEQDADWISRFDAVNYFKGKGVNVVIPQEGAFSYYTNWVDTTVQAPYFKGPQLWENFLLDELPTAIEPYLEANDKRAIAGFSMSATSSLVLPTLKPGFYAAAGSFSGCAATSSPHGYNFGRITINRASESGDYTSVTPEMMWGPMGSENNVKHDALLNAANLRDTALYISAGTGLASKDDLTSTLAAQGLAAPVASIGAAQLQVEGGVIEAAVNKCTHDLQAKLDSLGINAKYEFRNTGTHSWPVWRQDIDEAWTSTIAPALGVA